MDSIYHTTPRDDFLRDPKPSQNGQVYPSRVVQPIEVVYCNASTTIKVHLKCVLTAGKLIVFG